MDKIVFFWNGWEPLLRIVLIGSLTFLAIVILLKVSGKRSLANLNAFDFIITVAIGSAFGRILTAKHISLSESIVTFCLLVTLQVVFSYLEVHSKYFRKLITSQPTLLYYNEAFIEKNLKKQRVDKDHLMTIVRRSGFAGLEQVEVIIMETNGSFSIIKKSETDNKASYKQLLEE